VVLNKGFSFHDKILSFLIYLLLTFAFATFSCCPRLRSTTFSSPGLTTKLSTPEPQVLPPPGLNTEGTDICFSNRPLVPLCSLEVLYSQAKLAFELRLGFVRSGLGVADRPWCSATGFILKYLPLITTGQ
jgi:hypothetical protein